MRSRTEFNERSDTSGETLATLSVLLYLLIHMAESNPRSTSRESIRQV